MATTHEQFIEAAGGVVCRPAEDGVEIATYYPRDLASLIV